MPICFIRYDGNKCILQGEWTSEHLIKIHANIQAIDFRTAKAQIELDGRNILKMDTAGAWLFVSLRLQLQKLGLCVEEKYPSDAVKNLLDLVSAQDVSSIQAFSFNQHYYFFDKVGRNFYQVIKTFLRYLVFIGRFFYESCQVFLKPKSFRFMSFVSQINITGFGALPVIALLSFMVGVVLAYQMGIQLKNYGANIFIADLIGLSVLREFGPLLTAIMVAGRTGSAFTAELGMMKITQEIDALRTMGLTAEALLLIPRVAGLCVTLPLLAVWSDLFGILGGMVMANKMLGIGVYDFLYRLQSQIPLKTLFIGLGKMPVFALIIATLGCFQGMQVAGNADSLGKNTTRSVVFAIFFIIVADALFSIIFSAFSL